MKIPQIILHVDLDCFFAAVEARDHPEYRGKPLIIGADPKNGFGRGVVCTCSYEARKFGLHSAMPISQAYQLCPQGIYLHGSYEKYAKASEQVMAILKTYSDQFQPGGIDEAYLDITGYCNHYGDAKKIIDSIRAEIKEKVGITCSIGCAPTKNIAKIASDFNKPDGITMVEPDCIETFLKDLDVSAIKGIGKKTKHFYYEKGYHKIKDFYKAGRVKLIQQFGKTGAWIWDVITGASKVPIVEHYKRKSMGKERTFSEDQGNREFVIVKIKELNKKIHEELRDHQLYYRTITLKIRFRGFDTYTRSQSFSKPVLEECQAERILIDLFDKFQGDIRKIRLVGARFSSIEKNWTKKQLNLLDFLTQRNLNDQKHSAEYCHEFNQTISVN